MKIVPAQDWEPGSMRTVLRNTDYDDYYQLAGAAPEYSPGEIPQVEHTYAYLDASYSFMNENGVMIAESTIGGRAGMSNRAGWFDIVELQRIALERATTARECVQIMGAPVSYTHLDVYKRQRYRQITTRIQNTMHVTA